VFGVCCVISSDSFLPLAALMVSPHEPELTTGVFFLSALLFSHHISVSLFSAYLNQPDPGLPSALVAARWGVPLRAANGAP